MGAQGQNNDPAVPPSPNVALLKFISQTMAYLDQAERDLGGTAPALTATEKRRAGKFRKGGDKVVERVAAISKQHGLESPKLGTDAMLAHLQGAQSLVPLQQRLGKVLKRVTDEIFLAHGSAWGDEMKFYALLQRTVLDDGTIATAIAPVQQFFAHRHPSTKVGKVPSPRRRAVAKATHTLAHMAPDLLAHPAAVPPVQPPPAPAGGKAGG